MSHSSVGEVEEDLNTKLELVFGVEFVVFELSKHKD